MFFYLFAALIFTTIQSCGDLNLNKNSYSYSYQFNSNGCDTGQHNFNSRQEMCNTLKDNSANSNCAYNERYAKFQSDCYDMQW